MTSDLFGDAPKPQVADTPLPDQSAARPLADQLRPAALTEVLGQDHLLGQGAPLRQMLDSGSLPSLVLWGPPGCGKTTIARLLAAEVGYVFEPISAIFSGVADLKSVFARARDWARGGKRVLLFVDEIHRFNRAQQDAFLPVVEDGTVTLVGATTENPSFEINGALLSRARVLTLKRLDEQALAQLLDRAEALTGDTLPITDEARARLLALADGDGRFLLNLVESLLALPEQATPLDPAALAEFAQARAPLYDKAQEGHYNLISALHKCVRGSDPDAALYYFHRMLQGGEDPRYIARRMIRMASEDIGLADAHALPQVLAAADTYERLGSPEGELALAQALVYLAVAPKSNALYTAFKAAARVAKDHGSLMPPACILNAPTKLMKEQGYGAGYIYDHDTPNGFSGQNYWPDAMERQRFYQPTERGLENRIGERLQRLRDWRQQSEAED
ncbi:MAG: replication-associated recombination protein A [Alphaproteobacteria bacterium]